MKKTISMALAVAMILSCVACTKTPETSETTQPVMETVINDGISPYKYKQYQQMTPEQIVADLTLEQ